MVGVMSRSRINKSLSIFEKPSCIPSGADSCFRVGVIDHTVANFSMDFLMILLRSVLYILRVLRMEILKWSTWFIIW